MVGRRTSTVALRFTTLRLQLDPLCRFFCRRSAGSERLSIHSFLTTDLPCRSPPTADAQKIDLADPSQIPFGPSGRGPHELSFQGRFFCRALSVQCGITIDAR